MRSPHDVPLLSLAGATAEWRAGLRPSCLATVRLLDRVHLAVHAGECVIVQHDDPASVRVLLAALAGHARLIDSRVWRGQRRAAPAVQVRRASIRRDVAVVIARAWHGAGASEQRLPLTSGGAPVVHLLRASRTTTVAGSPARARIEQGQWARWAAAQRAHGGAVVLLTEHDDAPCSGDTSQFREPSAEYVWPEVGVRRCRLRHGRLLPVRGATGETHEGATDVAPS